MLTLGKKVKLHSGRMLTRNSIINLIGQGIPMLAALFVIPFLIKKLGTDRFGVLTLTWMVIGYFSLFDLGLGRALTQLVAKKIGTRMEEDIPFLVWSALFIMLILGLSGTLVVTLLSPLLVQHFLKIPQSLQTESLDAFYLLALSLPIVISTAGLRGVLEAHQRFYLINAIRTPLGIFNFISPLLVLPFYRSLFPIVGILVASRVVAWVIHLLLCFHIMPTLRSNISVKKEFIRPLLVFGGWMTVSNIVGPLMVYLDRFLIGAFISITAVAYYATPYEIITKLWLIPGAIVGVLFPAFSASFVQDKIKTVEILDKGLQYVFLILFPITLVIVTFAYEGLGFWLGAEFATHSTRVLQWLAVGVFVNSLAQVSFAFVQGTGRPDFTAKLHLIELPFYLLGVWWLIRTYGLKGAAIAWTMRVTVDMLSLFIMTKRLLPTTIPPKRRSILTLNVALLVLIISAQLESLVIKGLYLFLVLLFFMLTTWLWIFSPEERNLIRDYLKVNPNYS